MLSYTQFLEYSECPTVPAIQPLRATTPVRNWHLILANRIVRVTVTPFAAVRNKRQGNWQPTLKTEEPSGAQMDGERSKE